MDIRTAPGEKIRFIGTTGSDKAAREYADKHLTRNQTYTVARVQIENLTSFVSPKATVYLAEFPVIDAGNQETETFGFDAELFDNDGDEWRVTRRWHREYDKRRSEKKAFVPHPDIVAKGPKWRRA